MSASAMSGRAGGSPGWKLQGRRIATATLLAAAAFVAAAHGQQPQGSKTQPVGDREINFTATAANVDQSGGPVNIRIFRWSTDDERNPVVAALNPPPASAPAASPAERGGERGRAGRGGRGRRGAGAAAAPLTPIAALTAAIGRAPTVGYIWTASVTGYSIKYAFHAPMSLGGERVILATDRRLGAYSGWKPSSAAPATDYDFTLVELHLDSKGFGEGKTSLTTKVTVDKEGKTVALEDYAATPVVLQGIKRGG